MCLAGVVEPRHMRFPRRDLAERTAGKAWRRRAGVVAALAGLAAQSVFPVSASAGPPPFVAAASCVCGGGWETTASGTVVSFGGAPNFGSIRVALARPIVAMTSTPDGRGYWLAASDGGVFSFGDAHFYGSTGGVRLVRPIVAMVRGPGGAGYWLMAADGGVFSFGAARFDGSLAGVAGASLAAAVPSGSAYTLVQSSGAVLATEQAQSRPRPSATTTTTPTTTTTTTTTTTVTNTTTTTTAPTTTTTVTTVPAGSGSQMVLGVMEADSQWITADQTAGVNEAMMNIDWNQWEPQPGVFNSSYANLQAAAASRYRAAGWTVAVDVGLQSPPSWVLAVADGQLLDQNTNPSGTPDFEYSQAVRSAASTYISAVVSALGPVSSYRIGLGVNGEMMYPDADNNQWWAYAADAQQGGTDLPASVGISPMPGWIPGSQTWNGTTVTASQVTSWYNWYYGALVDGLAWEMGSFRGAGFGGQLQLLMPGDGALPALYSQRLAADLAPTTGDGYHTMNTGAVWWRMLDDLAKKTSLAGATVDITGVYDTSGTPRGNGCQVSDTSVPLGSADPWTSGWSDTRFVSYLAKLHNLPVMGENPGNTAPSDVAPTIGLAQSCGFTALQWAWDWQLHGTSSTVTSLSQLATAWAAAGLNRTGG
jgi:hypothetical protein